MQNEYGTIITMSVSVVIPTKNRGPFLKKALESVKWQTSGEIEEVFVLDTESTDNTKEVIEKSGLKVTHIKKPFKNQSEARNLGIEKAKSEYIAFLDSDDLWLEKKIEEQVTLMSENPHLTFSYTDAVVVDLDSVETPHSYIYHFRKTNEYQGKIAEKLFKEHNVIPTSSVMVKKSALLESGTFDDKLCYHEDRDLWIRLALAGEVGFVDKPLTVYTVHSGQFTNNNDELRDKLWKLVENKYSGIFN